MPKPLEGLENALDNFQQQLKTWEDNAAVALLRVEVIDEKDDFVQVRLVGEKDIRPMWVSRSSVRLLKDAKQVN